jgi:hypothetical protein
MVRRTAQGGAAGGVKKQPEGTVRERVRCSSLVDSPVYPRYWRPTTSSGRGDVIFPSAELAGSHGPAGGALIPAGT